MIFDMDGVLVNTEPLHYECWKAALADEGVDMSYEVYKPCIGSTVGYLMKLLKEAYGETVSDAETLRARMYAKKEEIVQKDGFPQIPGVKEAIKRFYDEGFRLEVASSSAGYYIGRVLDALEIRQCIQRRGSGSPEACAGHLCAGYRKTETETGGLSDCGRFHEWRKGSSGSRHEMCLVPQSRFRRSADSPCGA